MTHRIPCPMFKTKRKSMRLPRQSRFVAAMLAIVSVLFMQLAIAGYACPSIRIASIAASTAAIDHHGMPGCSGMDMDKPTPCHGLGGQQSLDKPESPHVFPFIAATLVQALSHVDPAYSTIAPPRRSLFLTRTTAPPLPIQNCCFRI